MIIRKATISDADDILRVVNRFAEEDLMLPRSLQEIYENIRDYFVCIEDGRLVGCAALHVFWKDLSEIKSLAVEETYQGKGIGKNLVKQCAEEAAALGINKLFVLTYLPDFFLRLGFHTVNKEDLPHKIWTECVKCHKFPDCKEVPLMMDVPTSCP